VLYIRWQTNFRHAERGKRPKRSNGGPTNGKYAQKLRCIPAVGPASETIDLELLTPWSRERGQVNLRRGWSFFTWNSLVSSLKTQGLGLAWGLHFPRKWGRRAEDPFRGLRAGPVRYSPLSVSPSGDTAFARNLSATLPKQTPTLPKRCKVEAANGSSCRNRYEPIDEGRLRFR
jgi:hypothetical protein